MSRQITVEVSDFVYGLLSRKARNIGRGTKPEQVAEDWIEHQARVTRDLDIKFIEAEKIVGQRLRAEAERG